MAEINNFASLIGELKDHTQEGEVTVERLLDVVGRRAYGPILLLLGALSISPLTVVPGVNWLLAFVTLLVGVQIVAGRAYPYIPRRFLDVSFSRAAFVKGLDVMLPFAVRVDRFLKPRLMVLTHPPFINLAALICVLAALVIFPLGLIPFGPMLPSLVILLFGLALTARDGFVLLVSAAGLVGAFWLALRLVTQLN